MLEKVPSVIGRALRGLRSRYDKIVSETPDFVSVPNTIRLESPAFLHEENLPRRFTADGERASPSLAWDGVPPLTRQLVLIVEDPDAPAFAPFVHLLAWDISPRLARVSEGYFTISKALPKLHAIGRNSFFRSGYLPPDPPRGHGPHRYVFQIFALDCSIVGERLGRKKLCAQMSGHALAKGVLIGIYERPPA